jgi:hypothetical protein
MTVEEIEPNLLEFPTEENISEWENFAKNEMESLGVLKDANNWLKAHKLPTYWWYGKFAYLYHEAPVWLFGDTIESTRFFHE